MTTFTLDDLKRDAGPELAQKIIEAVGETLAPSWFYEARIGETETIPYQLLKDNGEKSLEKVLDHFKESW